MRVSGAVIFRASLAAIAAYAVITALRWPAKAELFPLVMGIQLLVLALVQIVIDCRGASVREDAPPDTRAALSVMAWMALFIALVFLLGFPLAVPLFIVGYLAVAGR